MKILLIGSHRYKGTMAISANNLKNEGHEVKIPAFDDHPDWNEYKICKHNLELVKWADELFLWWDRRSMGTIFDFGMAFALYKPMKVINEVKRSECKSYENVLAYLTETEGNK